MYIYVYICISVWTGRKENEENILSGSWTRVHFTIESQNYQSNRIWQEERTAQTFL